MFSPEEDKATNVRKKARKPLIMPSTRTKHLFEKHGFRTQLVERFIPHSRRRVDFLGCADVMAMKQGHKIVAIQCFTSQWQQHKRKIIDGEEPEALKGLKLWMSLKNTSFIFLGFRKLLIKRGGKAVRWTPRFGRVKLTKKGNIKLIEVDTFEEAIR